jgi:alpha-galactosidase
LPVWFGPMSRVSDLLPRPAGRISTPPTTDGTCAARDGLKAAVSACPPARWIPVELKAGVKTIQFGNPTGYAPALDRIAIARTCGSAVLGSAMVGNSFVGGLRVWKFSLSNAGAERAVQSQVDSLSLTKAAGSSAIPGFSVNYRSKLEKLLRPAVYASVPIDFSRCSPSARFDVDLAFSSNNGAAVGNQIHGGQAK